MPPRRNRSSAYEFSAKKLIEKENNFSKLSHVSSSVEDRSPARRKLKKAESETVPREAAAAPLKYVSADIKEKSANGKGPVVFRSSDKRRPYKDQISGLRQGQAQAKVEKHEPVESEGDVNRETVKMGETVVGTHLPKKRKAVKAIGLPPTAGSQEVEAQFMKHQHIALRTRKFLGAHISAAGGAQNAPLNCFNIAAKRQPRVLPTKIARLQLNGPQHVLPHGSYLINLANPDPLKRKTSYEAFLDDLQRCEQVGVQRYVFHPGSTVGACEKTEGLSNVATCLNEALAATKFVTILLENMAGQKNMLCSTFEDLRDIIAKVEKKDRIGVCLDTCHLFAAGFDIRTASAFDNVMQSFDKIVGMKYLKGMHINDSKSSLCSGLDRHEHLGKGMIGIDAFKFVMQHPLWFKDMPLIIETPEEGGKAVEVWRDEIRMLYEFACNS